MSKQREALQQCQRYLEMIQSTCVVRLRELDLVIEALAEPTRKPLTDAEISAIVQSMSAHTWDAHMLARAIERAHGIGDD